MDKELPLLLSKEAMKKAGMMIDFTNDSAQIFGFHINLEITSSGHHTIPLSKTRNFWNNNINQEEEKHSLQLTLVKCHTKKKKRWQKSSIINLGILHMIDKRSYGSYTCKTRYH